MTSFFPDRSSIIVLWLMPDDFDCQREAPGWERVKPISINYFMRLCMISSSSTPKVSVIESAEARLRAASHIKLTYTVEVN